MAASLATRLYNQYFPQGNQFLTNKLTLKMEARVVVVNDEHRYPAWYICIFRDTGHMIWWKFECGYHHIKVRILSWYGDVMIMGGEKRNVQLAVNALIGSRIQAMTNICNIMHMNGLRGVIQTDVLTRWRGEKKRFAPYNVDLALSPIYREARQFFSNLGHSTKAQKQL